MSHRSVTDSTAQDLLAFDFQPRPRIVFGAGEVDRVGELARELGAKKILLVTDRGLVAAGHAGRVRKHLESAGLQVTVFDHAAENPTTGCVDKCLAAARAGGIDTIVGLGGGSSMDTAKGCNFLLTNGGRMQDYWGVGKATRPMLPFIAIPTTAGTGSECQSAALIVDEKTHQKMACLDPKAAARGPFGGLIASGWHTAAMMMRLFADHYLSKVASLASPGVDELRWTRPVRPGDTLTIRVTVLEANASRSKPDRGVVRTLIEVLNQNGDQVMSCKAINLLRRRAGA